MKIKHRFAFNTKRNNIRLFLDKHGIKYKAMHDYSIFYLYDDNDVFDLINDFMISNNETSIATPIYTKKELESAQWLTIKSGWNSLYPQPINQPSYIYTTYDMTNYCGGNPNLYNEKIGEWYREHDLPFYLCEKGLVQKDGFVLKKEPNWGSRGFTMLFWVTDELFISPKTEEVLNNNLRGIVYFPVYNKSKKMFDNVKQIYINNYVDKGLCIDSIERIYTCPICGFIKYWPKIGPIRFRKEIFENIDVDIVKTTDKFWERECDSLILVTNKFYKTIINAKLDRGLFFEPIELI